MKAISRHYLNYNHLICLSIFSIILYVNILWNEFIFEDIPFIVENPYIRDWHNISKFLFSFSRGIKYITLTLDYHIWGLNPIGYHLTNLLLHLIITILVYIFVDIFLKNTQISLITGLLFAAHPIHTEAVANISNRNDLLAMFFFLSSLILYAKRTERRTFYILSVFCYVLAVLSKEVAITLPLILILYDIYSGNKIYKNIRYYIPYFLIGCLFFVGAVLYLLSFFRQTDFGFSYPALVLLVTKTISFHIKRLILPIDLNADHEFSVPTAINMGAIGNVLIIIGLLTLFLMPPKKLSRFWKGISFGGLWIFINLIPVSNIIPLKHFVSNFVAERYLYISSLGFCLIMAIVANEILCVKKTFLFRQPLKKIAIYLLTVILGLYSGLTIARNFDWKSEYILWSKTIKQSPDSSLAHFSLGVVYGEKGLLDQAEVELKEALRIIPDYTNAYNNLGNVYLKKGFLDQAIKEYEEVLKRDSNHVEALYNLGYAYEQKGIYKQAINYYQRFLDIASKSPAKYQEGIISVKNHINVLTQKMD